MLPRSSSLLPGIVNTHGLTNDQMIILEAMDLQNGDIVHGEVYERYGCKEGNPPSRRGRGSQAFVAGDVPVMIAKRES